MSASYDAVVIGGGPGGATAALLLARAGWSVALVERKAFPRRKVCGEYLSATNLPLLDRLGVGDRFRERAGPEVRRVGLFAGTKMLDASLPRVANGWGRAWGRDQLDTLLLDRAAAAGTEVWQPWSAIGLNERGDHYECHVESQDTGQVLPLEAAVVILAHGSWETGTLPTQAGQRMPRPGDLFGFKAHFRDSRLAPELMPLLAFPGGYGGMVHTDDGRVSLSCCIRRDELSRIRAKATCAAGAAVFDHIRENCRGVRAALDAARLDGGCLAAGPIRPGIRLRIRGGVFPVGNWAGEAHPVVAEGISMALQSAWLLTRRLIAWKEAGAERTGLEAVGRSYARAWRRNFAPRLHAASVIAHWAMHPTAVASVLPVLRGFPGLLTWGAHWTGKATRVVTPVRSF
jgi:flavin-dependent dehydrogenase